MILTCARVDVDYFMHENVRVDLVTVFLGSNKIVCWFYAVALLELILQFVSEHGFNA